MPVHSTWSAGIATPFLGKRSAADADVDPNVYISLQRCQKKSLLEGDVHVLTWRAGAALLGRRFCALCTLPVADKCSAKFVLPSLVLGIGTARHTECFANIVHGAVEGELTAKLSRSERDDAIPHSGEHGLSFRVCSLARELIVKAALIFDTEFLALIGDKCIDFERPSFGAMPKVFGDLKRFVELDASNANAAFACWERKGNC